MKFKRFLKRNGINVEMWVLVVWILILIGIMFSLASCNATYHYRKFIDKGGQIQCENGYTSDSNKINIIVPPAKWQIRLDNKRLNDSLSAVLLFGKLEYKKYRDSLDNAYKIQKQRERTERTESKHDNKTDRTQAREDGKTERAGEKQDGKTARTEIRQTNKTERSKRYWFLWVLLGFCLKPITKFIYRKARDGLIRFRGH